MKKLLLMAALVGLLRRGELPNISRWVIEPALRLILTACHATGGINKLAYGLNQTIRHPQCRENRKTHNHQREEIEGRVQANLKRSRTLQQRVIVLKDQ